MQHAQSYKEFLHKACFACFCVRYMESDKSIFYLYHEGSANKEPKKACSSLWHCIVRCVSINATEPPFLTGDSPSLNKDQVSMRVLEAMKDSGKFNISHSHKEIRISLLTGVSELPNERWEGQSLHYGRLHKDDREFRE
jgi:hypothetical protein